MGTSLKQNSQNKGTSLAKNGLSANSSRQVPTTISSTKGVEVKKNTLVGGKK